MLSIGAMAGGQGQYYLKLAREDYYLEGGEPPGQWLGNGAKDLGLSGRVQGEALTRLLDGFHPECGQRLIQNAGSKTHQPGWDLTFSAPKSVSVLWSQAGPELRQAIQEAHFAGVQAALGYLEDTCAFTRRGKGGGERHRARLVTATFEHGTSRAQDPQLHTHALVMNVCTREDGTTGTLESKPFYQAKMTAGALYRAETAHQLEQRLGLPIERTGATYEVRGVSSGLMRDLSKRRAEIEKVLAARGLQSAAAAAMATLATREAKEHVPRAVLFDNWREAGTRHGWSERQAEALRQRAPVRDLELETRKALGAATEQVTAQQSFFSERGFLRALAEEAPGRGLGVQALRKAAARHLEKNPEVVPLGRRNGEWLYTTREMLQLERELLAAADRSRHQGVSGVSERTLNGVIASRGAKLSEEQATAVRHVAAPGARIRLVSGMAGTGKTTVLDAARLSWELEGFSVHGAALSGKAAQGLSDGAGIPSKTLHRTLSDLEQGRLTLSPRSVVVLDEAGMVGTRQMKALVDATERSGARLVLVGDARQLQPIDAGGPFAELERRLPTARLTEIRRQRDEWAREAVRGFARGEARRGLSAYAERGLLTVSEDRRGAMQALVSAWKERGIRAPEEQLIFCGTREEAGALNRLVQDARQQAGALGEPSIAAPGGGSFHVGDRVLFLRNSRLYGVQNGSLGEVTGVDAGQGLLSVRLDGGERARVSLSDYPHLRLGYAMTTHKGQGATVERAYVLAGGPMQDRELSYVQVSRSRGETRLFVDQAEAGERLSHLARQMAQSRQKELAHAVQAQVQDQSVPRPKQRHGMGF